jgi:hypothetical protein
MISVKELFGKIRNEGYFIRVDNSHPLELMVGVDDKGRKAIRLIGKFSVNQVKSTNEIEVNHFTLSSGQNTILLSLINDKNSSIFFKFCEDIIEYLRDVEDGAVGYQKLISRYSNWRNIFVRSGNIMSESEIMGLLGELIFLNNYLSKKIGIEKAIYSWTGQELTHKDFSNEKNWYEIKAVSKSKSSVHISSIEQLDSNTVGFLVVIKLEKMSSSFDGLKLSDVVSKILSLIKNENLESLFLKKLGQSGYDVSAVYDDLVYEIDTVKFYRVDEDFPKIQRSKISKAIKSVSYEISLADLEKNEAKEWNY